MSLTIRILSGILFLCLSFSTAIAQSPQVYTPFFQELNSEKSNAASANFEGWLKTQRFLASELTLSPLSSETDKLGFVHQRYQITKSGIPIEGAVLISHSNEQKQIQSFNGSLFQVNGISTTPKITTKEALQSAINHVGAETYRWEIEAENEHKKHIKNNENASYFPIPELVIAPQNLNFKESIFRLAYKIDIYALQPLQRLWVYVDAQTAEIIATQNQLCTAHLSTTVPASTVGSFASKNLCVSASQRSNSASTVDKVFNRCQSFASKNLCVSVPPCSLPASTVGKIGNCCQSFASKNLRVFTSQCSNSASTVDKVFNRCQSFASKNLRVSASLHSVFPLQDTPATAITKYSGTQTITTSQQNNTYLLQEESRNIATYNMHQSHIFSDATVFEDADNYWDNFNEDQDEVATDVHWATEKTYDYFLEKHGRKSFDGKGIKVRSYVHYLNPLFGSTFANAFWDGEHLTYGDGDGERRSAMTSLDICSHEFTHAVTDYTANLISGGESGALNESFSDIMAIAVEHYAKTAEANFLLGDEVALDGRAIRSAVRPKTLEAPDTYDGEYWALNQVHNRSNVQTHWFYLLVNGREGINDLDNSYQVTGIGLEAATEIAYRNLTAYLTPPATYQDARFFSIRAAMDLFGDCSFEAEQVAKAWYAVGVGEDGLKGTASFAVNETDFCSEEASVNFTNHSIWANSYFWDFGDGNSSTQMSPTHTYEAFGSYTVQMTATSCDGEESTIIRENLVHLEEESIACNTQNFNTEEQLTLTDCKGILYDDGGKLGDYTLSKESRVTIEVEDADYITLDFRQFDASNNHELYIYDGQSQNAPLIGVYWGSRLPNDGQTIVSKGNALYLRFNSYGGEERTFPGFEAEWNCHQTDQKPLVFFDFNDAFVCEGKVSFVESSLYQPTEWYWDFGDGNQSEEANPTHLYQKDGVFDVSLVACNDFGCDTLKQEAFVEVNREVDDCHEIRVPRTGKREADNCRGIIYDNNGQFGTYSNNSNGILTIAPPAVKRLGFNIQKFNTENHDDVLLIYDGKSIDAPLLLSESGTSFTKDTIWAESGAITLYFRSNDEENNRGFAINYFSVSETENPEAVFSWNPSNTPVGVPISFKNQSLKANQWYWSFGDGNTSILENPVHVFQENGIYEVSLTAQNCFGEHTLQKTIQVQERPQLETDLEEVEVYLVAGENTTKTLNLSNTGIGEMYFGVQTASFSKQDTLVEKTYTDLGTDIYSFKNIRPLTEFRLEVLINGDFDGSSEFLWLRMEDGSFYTVGINSESAANGTDISASLSFDVTDAAVAEWLADEELVVEVGKANQVGLEEGGKNYYQIRVVTDHAKWLKPAPTNGVIAPQNNQSMQVTFDASDLWEGTYFNELQIASNEKGNQNGNSLKIIPCILHVAAHPLADFKIATSLSCDGTMGFEDQSINEIDTWLWDFGDGTTSTEQHPTHQYTEKGYYDVSLKVCKGTDCDEVVKNILVGPIAAFNASPSDVPQNTEVSFSNTSQGATSYTWDFGDGTSSNERNPKHLFEEAGTYEIQLIAESCFSTDSQTKTLTVQESPQTVIPMDTLKVSLETGTQTEERIAVQNLGMGDLKLETVIETVFEESTVIFEEAGAKTSHVFEGIIASDLLQLKITLNGDFDESSERVWIRIDGEGVGYVLDKNLDTPNDESYWVNLPPSIYRHLLVDGKLKIELQNSEEVEPRPDRENKHSVELRAVGVSWLSVLQPNQSIEAQAAAEIALQFDARELNAGVYEIPLQVTTNETASSIYVIPTRLEVSGQAAMTFSETAINFGDVRINDSRLESLTLFNEGTDTLFVHSIGTQSPLFTSNQEALVLPPKTTQELSLTFSPTEIGVFEEELLIQSNVGEQTLTLVGNAIGIPKVSVIPDSLVVAIPIGEQKTESLLVSNTGSHPLSFSAENATFTRFDSLIVQEFHTIGDTSIHIFENPMAGDSLQLSFTLYGDYDEPDEFADLYVNDEWKAKLGLEDSSFVVKDSLSFAWEDLVEGIETEKIEVMLVNSEEVNTGFTISQEHEVRLKTFDHPWMNAEQETTEVDAGKNKMVEVLFDARNLSIGTYHQDIQLFGDDPEQGVVTVPTTLVVFEKPQAHFTFGLEEVCEGRVQFQNLSSGSASQWLWDFGDGQISIEENPEHVYELPGDYEVQLLVIHESVKDSFDLEVSVDFAIADFEVEDTVFTNVAVELTNNSMGDTVWYWDFGDGTTSMGENPLHSYDTTGVYMIQLIAESANGCLDTLQKEIVVEFLDVGIEGLNELPDWLRIYPNPVGPDQELQIEVNQNFGVESKEIQLYNSLGQLVRKISFEGSKQAINVVDLPKGLYHLQLQIGDFSLTQKIVVW